MLAVVAVLAIAVSGCGLMENNPDVVVIGDSITQQSAEEIRDALGGGYDVEVKAQAGKTIQEMSPFVKQAMADEPDAVIVNLGTNDTNGGTDFEADLQVVLDLIQPAECVIMVTVNDVSGLQPEAAAIAARINRMITTSGYRVWDWNSVVKEHPEWIANDAIHPSPAGRQAIARWYKAQLDDCEL